MKSTTRLALFLVAALACSSTSSSRAGEKNEDLYLSEVKPVLQQRCYACHGALQQKAGLRVDTVAAMVSGGDSGPSVEPGQVEESWLVDAVTGEAGFRMPPEGEPLKAQEVDAIKRWITAGAIAPADDKPQLDPREHWAFRAPERPEVPVVQDQAWNQNPIDAFLAYERNRQGVQAVAEADQATLLRRVSLDLTGLSPTREEQAAFLADDAPGAYERAVERLLASLAFGERWGRHWMDVWRYSDWDGYGKEVRESQPNIWRWRDWIVESLNNDTGYDRMVQQMLAGDELSPEDPEALRATGYLVRSWYRFNRNIWLEGTVEHTAKGFLGLTLNCARCHDHKYDPIPQADYYRFRALFEPYEIATDRVWNGGKDEGLARVYDAHAARPTYLFRRGEESQPVEDRPLDPAIPAFLGATPKIEPVTLPVQAYYQGMKEEARREALQDAQTAVEAARKKLTEARQQAGEDKENRSVKLAERELRAALAELEAVETRLRADEARYGIEADDSLKEVLALRAGLAERRARHERAETTRAQAEKALEVAKEAATGGDDKKQKEAVEAAQKNLEAAQKAAEEAAKAVAGNLPESYTPLTEVHPATSTGRRLALARWITDRQNPLTARVAVNHVWMRHFGTPLVETVFDFGVNGKSPTHPELLDWLAVEFMESGWSFKHLHRLIVTSRTYRLQSWSEPENSSPTIDPSNRYLWRMNPRRMEAELVRDNVLHVSGTLDRRLGGPDLDPGSDVDTPRRSLYFRHAKEKRVTFLKLFDSADASACYRRDVSVVPQQALAQANSPLTLAQARLLAGKLATEVKADGEEESDAQFIEAAFAQVLGRQPTDEERALCRPYVAEQAKLLETTNSLTAITDGPKVAVPASPDPLQRARENLVHVLFNHTDFVTIR